MLVTLESGMALNWPAENASQYVSKAFTIFENEYGFHHITTSAHYAQANGLVERTGWVSEVDFREIF